MDTLQQVIQLVTILFLLSMVCERIADFLKHCLSNSQLFNIQKEIFKIGDTITKFPNDDLKEQARAYRILKINVCSGILLALILKADLIKIFNQFKDPGKTIGWNYISEYCPIDIVLLPFGIILTGCFISFGSKFWHDLLDILYQIKNTKRLLADPETYKVDNIKSLQKLFDTYQSDFIKAAYLEAKSKFMAIENVIAISIKSNELGYYFELTASQNIYSIDQYYQYLLDDGTPKNIPIKLIVLPESDRIYPHSLDLSASIFDIKQADNWGTFGVLVKRLNDTSNKTYLLTCCHNVVTPIKKVDGTQNVSISAGSLSNSKTITIGNVIIAERDSEMDAALIQIDLPMSEINNSVPKMGNPKLPRQLFNRDAGKVEGFVYGAKSGKKSGSVTRGIVTSIYNTIKVEYSDGPFELQNVLSVSNNGLTITESGDSGACVLDSNNNVLGLVVAGNSKVTYVIPINILLGKLNVQLI